MPSSRNLFLAVAAFFCAVGLAVVFFLPAPAEPPLPKLPTHASPQAPQPSPAVPASVLRGPWASPPVPPHRSVPAPVVVQPQAPGPPPDQTSVRYLGVLTGDSGVKTYLFKYLPSGRALPLVEGVENQGWTLTQVSDQAFALRGPGGMYAVSR